MEVYAKLKKKIWTQNSIKYIIKLYKYQHFLQSFQRIENVIVICLTVRTVIIIFICFKLLLNINYSVYVVYLHISKQFMKIDEPSFDIILGLRCLRQ